MAILDHNTLINGNLTLHLVLVTIIACIVDDLGAVFSITGSTTVPMLCYWFPALALWKLGSNDISHYKLKCFVMIVLAIGVTALSICNLLSFFGVIKEP